jgi:hypothetical protein
MYNIKKLYPVALDDLVRIGRNYDGGYVLSKRQVEQTKTLFSFGINDDWSFEEDFLKQHKVALFAYDASVSIEIFKKSRLHHLTLALGNFICFNFVETRKRAGSWLGLNKTIKTFSSFFDARKHRFFFKKFVGTQDNEIYSRLDTILNDYISQQDVEDLSIFLKMDVEKYEYLTLDQLPPFFDKINGLCVEFHQLDVLGDKFEKIIDLFSPQFAIAHIHGNNYGSLIPGTNLPETLEVTFINRTLLTSENLSTQDYPIPGLDFPCNQKASDYSIFS